VSAPWQSLIEQAVRLQQQRYSVGQPPLCALEPPPAARIVPDHWSISRTNLAVQRSHADQECPLIGDRSFEILGLARSFNRHTRVYWRLCQPALGPQAQAYALDLGLASNVLALVWTE